MLHEVLAPLASKVINLCFSAGDKVEDGDEVIIIEAMKMETLVFAPYNGTIKEIRVKAGDAVEEDDVLAIIA